MKNYLTKKGQIVLEFLWLIIFVSSFLSAVLYFYENTRSEIKKYKIGKEFHYGSPASYSLD